jgi:hypothetical protein
MTASEPGPATWLAYESVMTPVGAGPMKDVLDVAHGLLAVAARSVIAVGISL